MERQAEGERETEREKKRDGNRDPNLPTAAQAVSVSAHLFGRLSSTHTQLGTHTQADSLTHTHSCSPGLFGFLAVVYALLKTFTWRPKERNLNLLFAVLLNVATHHPRQCPAYWYRPFLHGWSCLKLVAAWQSMGVWFTADARLKSLIALKLGVAAGELMAVRAAKEPGVCQLCPIQLQRLLAESFSIF